MSVYKKDRLSWFRKSVDSILNQSYGNIELIVSRDGEVGVDIDNYLDEIGVMHNIHVFKYDTTLGLAHRLNQMIDFALLDIEDVKYIARMDADDESFIDRISLQVDLLETKLNIDICGTSLIEINSKGEQIFVKRMAEDDHTLKANIIKRCPFNHPTVMFRRRVFDSGLRYNSKLKNTQDYYFWIELASKGYVFANISVPLLYFRMTDDFFNKRGLSKAINDFNAKLYAINCLSEHSIRNYMYAFGILGLRLAPSCTSRLAYNLLRK